MYRVNAHSTFIENSDWANSNDYRLNISPKGRIAAESLAESTAAVSAVLELLTATSLFWWLVQNLIDRDIMSPAGHPVSNGGCGNSVAGASGISQVLCPGIEQFAGDVLFVFQQDSQFLPPRRVGFGKLHAVARRRCCFGDRYHLTARRM